MDRRIALYALAALAIFAALARVLVAVVIGHTHHRGLGAVVVTLALVVLAVGLARLATRLGRAALPLALGVALGSGGATYLGVLCADAVDAR